MTDSERMKTNRDIQGTPRRESRGIPPSGESNDFVGYEVLIDFMEKRGLQNLEGDIIEIGAFMGGGTVKLAGFGLKYGKDVYAVDIFDPDRDKTPDKNGVKMCDIYRSFLQGRSQLEVYQQATRSFDNIVTINMDSSLVSFHERQKFIFGFVDGNHRADYVKSDFNLIWRHLVPGGGIGFHDYNFDLPEVTAAVDGLISEHKDEISEVCEIKQSHILILTRNKGPARK